MARCGGCHGHSPLGRLGRGRRGCLLRYVAGRLHCVGVCLARLSEKRKYLYGAWHNRSSKQREARQIPMQGSAPNRRPFASLLGFAALCCVAFI